MKSKVESGGIQLNKYQKFISLNLYIHICVNEEQILMETIPNFSESFPFF